MNPSSLTGYKGFASALRLVVVDADPLQAGMVVVRGIRLARNVPASVKTAVSSLLLEAAAGMALVSPVATDEATKLVVAILKEQATATAAMKPDQSEVVGDSVSPDSVTPDNQRPEPATLLKLDVVKVVCPLQPSLPCSDPATLFAHSHLHLDLCRLHHSRQNLQDFQPVR